MAEPKRSWKILARHRRIVPGLIVTEAVDVERPEARRFTASIGGRKGVLLYEGIAVNNERLRAVRREAERRRGQNRDAST